MPQTLIKWYRASRSPGFGRIYGAAERGEMGLVEALRRSAERAVERVHATTPQERRAVRELSSRS